jgi:GTPase Era involved in 16S rRNA processing
MEDIEDWSDIASMIMKLPLSAYENRFSIQKWWKQFQVYWGVGKTNVIVLGRPSVGKSVMLSYLYGETNDLSWQLPDTSKNTETKAMTLGDWTSLIRTVPGQSTEERYRAVNEAFNTHKKLEGVIYVADWGFTDVRDGVIKRMMIEDQGIDSIDKLREHNLKREREDFSKICDSIKQSYNLNKSLKWILILVNKVDLFYDDKKINEAQKYYHPKSDSEFSEILRSSMGDLEHLNIACKAIPMCSYPKDFLWNGEMIKTDIRGEANKKALARNFFSTVSKFYR